MHGTLLMTDQDVLDLGLLKNLVVDRQHGAAGIAEQVFDTLVGERFEHHFGAGQFLAHRQLHVPAMAGSLGN